MWVSWAVKGFCGVGDTVSPFFKNSGAVSPKRGILSPFFVNYVVKITTICQMLMAIFGHFGDIAPFCHLFVTFFGAPIFNRGETAYGVTVFAPSVTKK